jgi:hypothetical protein
MQSEKGITVHLRGVNTESRQIESDTKQSKSEEQLPQGIEKMADPERLELPTSAFEVLNPARGGATPKKSE